MTVDSKKRARTFTVAEANAALPLIRAIVGDIVELTQSTMDRRERLQYLKQGRDPNRSDIYQDELDSVEQVLEEDASRLQRLIEELTELGVEPKSLPEGLIDFPSTRDGRSVYLCWKYDEPEVAYWHELNDGYSGRQAVHSNEDPTSRLSLEVLPADSKLTGQPDSSAVSGRPTDVGSGENASSESASPELRTSDNPRSDSDFGRN